MMQNPTTLGISWQIGLVARCQVAECQLVVGREWLSTSSLYNSIRQKSVKGIWFFLTFVPATIGFQGHTPPFGDIVHLVLTTQWAQCLQQGGTPVRSQGQNKRHPVTKSNGAKVSGSFSWFQTPVWMPEPKDSCVTINLEEKCVTKDQSLTLRSNVPDG